MRIGWRTPMFMVSQKFMVSRLEDQTYPSRQSSFWLEAIENEMRIAWKDEMRIAWVTQMPRYRSTG